MKTDGQLSSPTEDTENAMNFCHKIPNAKISTRSGTNLNKDNEDGNFIDFTSKSVVNSIE